MCPFSDEEPERFGVRASVPVIRRASAGYSLDGWVRLAIPAAGEFTANPHRHYCTFPRVAWMEMDG